jgi:seryl-tRNA synthetase
MDKKEAGSPVKRGRPLKKPDPNEDEKKRKNREAQNRYKQKVGKQIGSVVNDLDECDEERANLKDKVKTLSKLLADCEAQVSGIMNSVRSVPKMGAKTGSQAKAKATSVIQNQASTMIGSAIRQNLARKKLKEAEKDMTFDILTRGTSFY